MSGAGAWFVSSGCASCPLARLDCCPGRQPGQAAQRVSPQGSIEGGVGWGFRPGMGLSLQ